MNKQSWIRSEPFLICFFICFFYSYYGFKTIEVKKAQRILHPKRYKITLLEDGEPIKEYYAPRVWFGENWVAFYESKTHGHVRLYGKCIIEEIK